MAIADVLVKLAGTTIEVAEKWQVNRPIRPLFFKPYASLGDFAYRGASIVAAPIMGSGISIGLLLLAGWKLLTAIVQAIGSNFSTRWENDTSAAHKLADSADYAKWAGMFLVYAIISPFLNAIDFIGAAFVTAIDAITPAEDDGLSTGPGL